MALKCAKCDPNGIEIAIYTKNYKKLQRGPFTITLR